MNDSKSIKTEKGEIKVDYTWSKIISLEDRLWYLKHILYSLIKLTNQKFNKSTKEIKWHHQNIQFKAARNKKKGNKKYI